MKVEIIMEKLLLLILTVCLLLALTACTQPPAPEPAPDEPSVPGEEIQQTSEGEISENPGYLWIEANGEVFLPYDHWVWADSYEDDGTVLCADGEAVSTENDRDFENFVDDLPVITYADDFEIFLDENVTGSTFTVYGMNHSEITKGSASQSCRSFRRGNIL